MKDHPSGAAEKEILFKRAGSRQIILFILWAVVGVILIGPVHEFGHCLFYWGQGVPASMSLTKEFPLRDISVQEYAVGSFGGIFFSWLALVLFFLIQDRATRTSSRAKAFFQPFFVGQNMIGFIYLLQVFLKRSSPGELQFAEAQFHLPRNSLFWFTIVLSLAFLVLLVYRLGIKIRLRPIVFFVCLYLLSIVFIGVEEELDKNLFWSRFPTIKIGESKLYNEPLPKR